MMSSKGKKIIVQLYHMWNTQRLICIVCGILIVLLACWPSGNEAGNTFNRFIGYCPAHPSEPAISFGNPIEPTSILVTGGAGYIGSHFILLLLEQKANYKITILDDLSRGNKFSVEKLQHFSIEFGKSPIEFVDMTLRDTQLVADVLTKHKVDMVVHFAAYAFAGESVKEPLVYFENVAESTRVLMSAMESAGVSKILYSSSSATYGLIERPECDVPLRETSPQNPVSPYGQGKLIGEQIIKAYALKAERGGRPFSYAGAHNAPARGGTTNRHARPRTHTTLTHRHNTNTT